MNKRQQKKLRQQGICPSCRRPLKIKTLLGRNRCGYLRCGRELPASEPG